MIEKEIVVAAYNKSLGWMDFLSNDVKKSVYRKGNLPLSKGEILIEPNVGRCVHTFFNHLLLRYDSLAEYTFFCQDFPFDHWGNIVEIINGSMVDLSKKSSLSIGGYHGYHNNRLGSAWNMPPTQQFLNGRALSCLSNGYPQHMEPGVNVDEYWDLLFNEPRPKFYEFMPGGHFAISRDQVRIRSRNFYEKICNLLAEDVYAPWKMERLECYVFCENYKTKI